MAKYTYSPPGMTLLEIETRVGALTGLDRTVAADLTKIDEAISVAGQTACVWEGQELWFMPKYATFPTVNTTKSYALRTVNTNAMQDLWSIRQVWYVERKVPVWPVSYAEYLDIDVRLSTWVGPPIQYVVNGEPPYIYLKPIPDAVYTVGVEYERRHSKIVGGASGAEDSCLLIPGEFHWPVYVMGSVYLLRLGVTTPYALTDSPEFTNTIRAMQAAKPDGYDHRPAWCAASRGDPYGGANLPDLIRTTGVTGPY